MTTTAGAVSSQAPRRPARGRRVRRTRPGRRASAVTAPIGSAPGSLRSSGGGPRAAAGSPAMLTHPSPHSSALEASASSIVRRSSGHVPDRVDRGRRVQHLLHRERHVAVRRGRRPRRRGRDRLPQQPAERELPHDRRVVVHGGDRRRQAAAGGAEHLVGRAAQAGGGVEGLRRMRRVRAHAEVDPAQRRSGRAAGDDRRVAGPAQVVEQAGRLGPGGGVERRCSSASTTPCRTASRPGCPARSPPTARGRPPARWPAGGSPRAPARSVRARARPGPGPAGRRRRPARCRRRRAAR